MLNCYCQLSSSVIFRQYGVSQSECKIVTGPDQGFLVSPLVLTRKPLERGWGGGLIAGGLWYIMQGHVVGPRIYSLYNSYGHVCTIIGCDGSEGFID
jgi:hypothetical protein